MEKRNPWAWIPSLYFAEGLPYVVVMTLSVISVLTTLGAIVTMPLMVLVFQMVM